MHTRIGLGNYFPLLAIPFVIAMPEISLWFAPYTRWLLGALMFFSFLGLGLTDLVRELRNSREAFYVSLVILVLTPLVIYPVMQRFFPEYLAGAFLFMLLPSAVSSPAVAALYGGKVAKATLNTVVSNLLCPFTITLFLALFMRANIHVDLMKIFFPLLVIIAVPFALGLLAHRVIPKWVDRTKHYYRPINLFLLFLFFVAALSPYGAKIVEHVLDGRLWTAVLVTYAVLFCFAKLSVLHQKDRAERVAIESNLLFLNVGLGVLLAQSFFGTEEILFIVFCEIVWLALVPLLKYFR
ncbi:MAG: bile acid:sodium symporter [Candidatus Peregrinibacteria bacterium]